MKNTLSMSALITTSIFTLATGCANATNNSNDIQTKKTTIIYIDDESNVLNKKQRVFFRENNLSATPTTSEISRAIVKHAKNMPSLEIKITYKAESDLANQVASQIHEQVGNQIYIEHCCKLDSGRVNLKGNQINISYYK